MAAFGLTSLACGLAPDAWSLVAARVAQGASAAAMLPQVLATIQATTTGPRRAKAMSLYGATAGLSMVAYQILGGVLVAADIAGTGWRSVFLVNVPVVLAGLFLAARAVPETRSARPEPVDVPGTFLLAASILTLLVPLTEGRAAGWPLWTWLSLAAFPFAAAAFYAVERRADRAGRTPLVPPSLFAIVSLRRGLLLIVPFSIGFSGFMFVIAVALQQGAGLGPVAAGLALAPLAVVFFLFSLMRPPTGRPLRHPRGAHRRRPPGSGPGSDDAGRVAFLARPRPGRTPAGRGGRGRGPGTSAPGRPPVGPLGGARRTRRMWAVASWSPPSSRHWPWAWPPWAPCSCR